MIIEYDEKYIEDVKDLLLELQEHIASLDDEKFNIVTPNYREEYYVETMKEIKEKNGKMFLYRDNDDIIVEEKYYYLKKKEQCYLQQQIN